MSIIEQLKSAINRPLNDRGDTQTSSVERINTRYNSIIHNNIVDAGNNDDRNAKIIEKYLRVIKVLQVQMSETKNKTDVISALDDEMMRSFMMALYDKHRPLFTSRKLYGKYNSSYSQGDALEQSLASFIKTIEATMLNKSYTSKKLENQIHKTGSVAGLPAFIEELTDNAVIEVVNNAYNAFGDLQKEYEGKKEIRSAATLGAVSQKVDVVGITGNGEKKQTIQLQGTVTNNIPSELWKALQDATFTAKNYSKYAADIHFGATNIVRVYLSVMCPDIEHFYRMVQCFTSHSLSHNEDSKTKFYRMRIIYELTGLGTKVANTQAYGYINDIIQNSYAKYLILNNPDEPNFKEQVNYKDVAQSLYVIPTTKIIKDLIVKTSPSSHSVEDILFSPITIKQDVLKNNLTE